MNNRKMIVSVFVGLVVSLFIARAVVAQTEELGLVQYTPPKGWAKSARQVVPAQVWFDGVIQEVSAPVIIRLSPWREARS